jgi:ribonuclease D
MSTGLTEAAAGGYGRALMDAAWIDSTEALAEWTVALDGAPLAVDTEADSFHHYREKVCLVQLSAGDRHALIDPLAAIDLKPLQKWLADASVPKVLHGADYDIRLLARDFGLSVSGLIDTMIAARILGEPAVGLAALLEKYLAVSLDKAHQRADWSRRPLTAAMREYAVEDTRHLVALASILEERLRELGRAPWVAEECARLESVRWRDRRDDDPEPFRRTKGARGLDRAGLARVRELWNWRDAIARRRDVPAFRVLRDETLLVLVKTPPASVGDLTRIGGIASSMIRSPAALELLEAVRRGGSCPEAEYPELRTDVRERLAPAVEARIARIRTERDRVAQELALDPAVILSRATIEEMAKRWESGDDPWAVSDLRQWQVGLLRGVLS